ncbi:MAG: GTPase Era [Deltaproteobacteria bacterium CG07_land_8_20_14_0_80_60_11]|nr:MAG: GTPase Era [Deltaproteobacteria bacterium CG07_land_8_20_14_0_80_60_11]
MPEEFKCGYIALMGFPNVGKSTLLNRLVGEKLAITSPKPQTTRQRLLGIVNRPEAQLLFLDTPGVLDPKGALNASLVAAALKALAEADLVVWLVEPRPPAADDRVLLPQLRRLDRPLIMVINKIDTVAKPRLLPLISAYHEMFPGAPIIPLSALLGDGVAELMAEIVKLLPASPPLYPPDQETDSTERFLTAELIRERVLHHTSEEIPHAVAVQVEEFDESRRPHLVRIRAVIFVERNSQKGILIGKQGRMLKAIGAEARGEIEALLGAKVFLELWVKVWKNWRKDPKALRALGLQG